MGKKSSNMTDKVFIVLNVFVSLALLACSIGSEWVLRSSKFEGDHPNSKYAQGITISIVTSTVNVIYKYLAKFMTDKQNHKYLHDKEKSFMLNMVIFKLINTNVTVVWSVNQIIKNGVPTNTVDEEGNIIENETPMEYIQGLILSLVIAKAYTPLLSKHFFRFAKFQFKKWDYFRKVAAKGRQ